MAGRASAALGGALCTVIERKLSDPELDGRLSKSREQETRVDHLLRGIANLSAAVEAVMGGLMGTVLDCYSWGFLDPLMRIPSVRRDNIILRRPVLSQDEPLVAPLLQVRA